MKCIPWNKEQEQWLKDNINIYKSYRDLCNGFNKNFGTERTPESVRSRCHNLNIRLMTRFTWTKELTNSLIKLRKTSKSIRELTEKFNKLHNVNVSEVAVKSKFIKTHNIDKNTIEVKSHKFTEEHKSFLKENLYKSSRELVKLFKDKFNLSITPSAIRRQKRKIDEWVSYKKEEKNAIKKYKIKDRVIVSVPESHPYYNKLKKYSMHDTYTVSTGKSNQKLQVREHVYNWITAGREIPEGYYVVHIDGNTLNNNIDNLRCASQSVISRMQCILGVTKGHKISEYSTDFNDAVFELSELQDALNNNIN